MKAASLLCVFVVARLVILTGFDLEWSFRTPLALFWQDAAFVLGFAILERVPRSRLVIAGLYWLIAFYIALNVPVARMFSTPLTLPMLRATRGTLADSIGHHVDVANLVSIALVLATALIAPLCLRRAAKRIFESNFLRARVGHPAAPHRGAVRSAGLRPAAHGPEITSANPSKKLGAAFFALLSLVCLLGFRSRAGIDTAGLHRNCVAALLVSGHEQVAPVAHADDWRKTFAAERSTLAPWQGTAQGRDVVLILLESTGARHLKFYGAELDSTPNLTRMAESGIVFDRAYAAYPESIKGLFSILCSRYPAIETSSENYRHIGKPSLAHVLRKAGYRTALFHSGRFIYLGMEDVIQERGYEQLFDAGAIGGQRESSFGVEEPATVERMLQWLEHLPADKPFFLTYLPTAGHHPYLTPAAGPFSEETDARRYLNALHYGDQALGQLFEGMKKLGRYENSLFVFCGDHGEAFGEHAGNFGHTLYLYEENIRVPLVVFAPGLTTAQYRVPHLASVIDIAPTILDLLGLEVPLAYQGVTLLRVQPETALFFTDYSTRLVGLREERWKFIYEFESGRSSLFDLEHDPRETINLCARFPERTRLYESRAKAWSAAQKQSVLRDSARAREPALASDRAMFTEGRPRADAAGMHQAP
jgi:arylsulfatase A-like enzyme